MHSSLNGFSINSKGVFIFVISSFFMSQLADERLYEHWKQNAPELRQVSIVHVCIVYLFLM